MSSFVVVANRLPVDEVVTDTGRSWRRSPGGLVTALHPVLAAHQGSWIGWSGGVAADTSQEPDTPPPFDVDDVALHPVPLTSTDVERYYEGFSNGSLWPLYHDAIERPVFRRKWWEGYLRVNQRFAAAAARVASPGATVWVQDYQLQLVPAMLRERRPDLHIGFFLHIPFPPVELFMQLPRRVEILRGLLGADLVGFQRPLAAQNFLRLTRHLLGLRPRGNLVDVAGREVCADSFPISIDVAEIEQIAQTPYVRERAARIRAELGEPKTVILGVDRLDYTKGIEGRIKAFRELLSEGRLSVPETVMVQVATPSRERVRQYQSLRVDVEREVGRINGDYGRVGVPAVHYLHQSYSRTELVALFRAADIMMVTPLRDGMNLVAKEYVAARVDHGGALVLSEFAGAAGELRQAFQVNPYDLEGMKDTLMRAVHVDSGEAVRRMRAMRRYLRGHDVSRWASSFLATLAGDQLPPSAGGAAAGNGGPTGDSPTGGDATGGDATEPATRAVNGVGR
jgi:trehalose 6-phosphate synthase